MILSILLLFFGICFVFAKDNCRVKDFYSDRERGFYYGRLCLEKKKNEKPEQTMKKVVIPWERLESMNWREIRKLVEEARGIAVMNPTYENVREYKKLMLWILKKGLEFQKMDRIVTLTSGDVFSLSLASPYYSRIHSINEEKKVESTLRKFKDKAGLVVFYDNFCSYCSLYIPIVKLFSEETGWNVIFLNIREFPRSAKRLGVKIVPDTFLVLKRGNKKVWQRVGTGAFTLDDLKRNVVIALTLLGEVKYEEVFGVR